MVNVNEDTTSVADFGCSNGATHNSTRLSIW